MTDKLGLTGISFLFLATLAACGGEGEDGVTTATTPSGTTGAPAGRAGAPASDAVEFIATFPTLGPMRTDLGDGNSKDGVWYVEQKVPGRAVVVNVGRDDGTGLRLHTEPGDNDVSGSNAYERNDVALVPSDAYGMQGMEQWWAHSVRFPDDFAIPSSGSPAIVFDVHDTRYLRGRQRDACMRPLAQEDRRRWKDADLRIHQREHRVDCTTRQPERDPVPTGDEHSRIPEERL